MFNLYIYFWPTMKTTGSTSYCVNRKCFYYYLVIFFIGHIQQNSMTKRKAADNTLGQRFLEEFKATCKNSGESELK